MTSRCSVISMTLSSFIVHCVNEYNYDVQLDIHNYDACVIYNIIVQSNHACMHVLNLEFNVHTTIQPGSMVNVIIHTCEAEIII